MKKMGFFVYKMYNIIDICILGIVDKLNLYFLLVKVCYVKIKLEIYYLYKKVMVFKYVFICD